MEPLEDKEGTLIICFWLWDSCQFLYNRGGKAGIVRIRQVSLWKTSQTWGTDQEIAWSWTETCRCQETQEESDACSNPRSSNGRKKLINYVLKRPCILWTKASQCHKKHEQEDCQLRLLHSGETSPLEESDRCSKCQNGGLGKRNGQREARCQAYVVLRRSPDTQ